MRKIALRDEQAVNLSPTDGYDETDDEPEKYHKGQKAEF